ncbi:MAG TPA: FTR1 family protein [Candidatus Binatia bacterium]|nr:FTR1 family protein [Candidatus Binatia bacterium]
MTPQPHIDRAVSIRPSVRGPGAANLFGAPRPLLAAWALLLSALLFAGPVLAQDQAKRLVALLDYLGSDYKNAVKDGKVISQDEFGEMQEFAKRSLELFAQLKAAGEGDKAGIEPNLKTLASHVERKADPADVARLARETKDKLIAAYGIVPYPRRLPSLAAGKKLYDENCAQCHGVTGKGDGPGRESMNPKTPLPANFTDPERIGGLSPFKAFNTASFGIDGTAMASFSALSEEQRWQVAFYIFTLRFSDEAAKAGADLAQAKNLPAELKSVATLATTSDDQLLERLEASGASQSEAENLLAFLRRGLSNGTGADPIAIARRLLAEAVSLYGQGEKEKAYQKAVEAYLDGFELAEPALFAKDNSFGRGVENQLTEFRNAIRRGDSLEAIRQRHLELESKLEQAARLLAEKDTFSGYYAFLNSALIILREGLEAALILAAILAMLRVMGAQDAARYVHLGWILALIAGGLTWLATETVLTLSGRHRESMEGFISVFAAVALFYVGYWLHTRSEAKKWQSFIHAKVQDALSSRRIFGLAGLSFFAVYREAFEVVLFYQALWLQSEDQHAPILWGFAGGLAALLAATVAILKLGLKIPLKYFFGATGTLLYIVAFIFAGNGIRELQAALWLPTTPLSVPNAVPALGIYPTVETLAAQGLMLCAFVATSVWVARERRKA